MIGRVFDALGWLLVIAACIVLIVFIGLPLTLWRAVRRVDPFGMAMHWIAVGKDVRAAGRGKLPARVARSFLVREVNEHVR